MVKMTDEEWMRFVLEKPRPAVFRRTVKTGAARHQAM